MLDIEILIENGDEYGEHDLLISQCKMPIVPRTGEFLRIDGKGKFLVQKIQYSVMFAHDKTFIKVYVYKI